MTHYITYVTYTYYVYYFYYIVFYCSYIAVVFFRKRKPSDGGVAARALSETESEDDAAPSETASAGQEDASPAR